MPPRGTPPRRKKLCRGATRGRPSTVTFGIVATVLPGRAGTGPAPTALCACVISRENRRDRMRRIRALAGLALVVLMTGCVRSVNPIYTEGDLTFDPGLLGAWLEKDGKDIWIFEQAGD